jgi:hypothetical protein
MERLDTVLGHPAGTKTFKDRAEESVEKLFFTSQSVSREEYQAQ